MAASISRSFPSNQLGSDTDTLSQVRSGGVEFFTLSGLILSTLVPAASINGGRLRLPGLCHRSGRRWTASSAPMSAQQIAKADLVAMDKIWDNGFRQITSSTKPINDARRPEGLQDPRAGRARSGHRMFKAFGASPDLDQLQRGLFGAADQGRRRAGEPAGRSSRPRSCTRCRSTCSMTNHMWDGFWFLGNRRAWERLPDDLQDHRRKAHQRSRRWNSARTSPSSMPAVAAGPHREGHGVQPAPTRRRSATSWRRPASMPNGRASSETRPGQSSRNPSASSA